MAEQGDLDELARRYLDLWQDQMTALANDPEMAEATEQMLRLMGFAPPEAETAAHAGPGAGDPWANAQAWQQAMQGTAMAGTQAAGQQAGAAWGWPIAMMTALAQAAQQVPGGWPGAGGPGPGWPPSGWGAPGYPPGPPPGWAPPGASAGWPGMGWMSPHGGTYPAWGPPPGHGPPPSGYGAAPGWAHSAGPAHPGEANPAAPPGGGPSDPAGAGQAGTPGAQGSADDRRSDRGDVAQPHERTAPAGPDTGRERRGGTGSGPDDGGRGSGARPGADDAAAEPAAGAAAAAGAPGGGDLDLDELAGRLARLEERLAALEGPADRGDGGAGRQSGGKTGKPAPGNRKRGS
jgi:hypothetical protein